MSLRALLETTGDADFPRAAIGFDAQRPMEPNIETLIPLRGPDRRLQHNRTDCDPP
jgi:hypothetical protein